MTIPLYQALQEQKSKLPDNTNQANLGLWFDRFFDQYNPEKDWKLLEPEAHNSKQGKAYWLQQYFTKSTGDADQLKQHTDKQIQLADQLQGKTLTFKAVWHFVTGMGNPHPVENGFAWHPTLGVPYLTGAAVKGLIRSYIENHWQDNDDEAKRELLFHWFGSDDKDPKKVSRKRETQAGKLIFFDALPIEPVMLGTDIMTPHMGKWYSDGGNPSPETVPADWHDPTPIPFLVAKQITLLFSFAYRPFVKDGAEQKINLNDVEDVLTKALAQQGAGGKTTTGYGGMVVSDAIVGIKKELEPEEEKDEDWESAVIRYEPGSKILSAESGKDKATLKGSEAKELFDSLSGAKQKKAKQGQLNQPVSVHYKGDKCSIKAFI